MTAPETNNTWSRIKNTDPNCFACGFDNKHGLNMRFETNGEKLRSQVIVPSHLRGWSNLVHGGIISTIIDETMSWTAIHLLAKFILTKNMKITFKRPLKIDMPVIIYGYIKEKSDKDAIVVADIYGKDDKLYSSGQGEFALFSPDEFSKLGVIDEAQLKRMTDAYEWCED